MLNKKTWIMFFFVLFVFTGCTKKTNLSFLIRFKKILCLKLNVRPIGKEYL